MIVALAGYAVLVLSVIPFAARSGSRVRANHTNPAPQPSREDTT